MEPDIFIITKLLSEPSRMRILDILMDGKAHTVNEIANYTRIKQHTVSYHLKLLTNAQLTTVQVYGRCHYYSLKNQETAEMLEFFSSYVPPKKVNSYRQHFQNKELKKARTCYDHIAGELGVAITKSLISQKLLVELEKHFELTDSGRYYFNDALQINIKELQSKKRKFCAKCLDWSERENHVAGALGNAIFQYFTDNQFIEPSQTPRSLNITKQGIIFLEESWGITL